jgi:hypothetical protein
MKNKNWLWLIGGIVLIAVVVFLFIRSTMNVNNDSTPEIPQIKYQEDPNFDKLHPKGDQFSVGITGEEMNILTLEENALIWGVDIDDFVNAFNSKFNTNAKSSDKLGNVLPEYKNSNRDVKIILDGLK